MEQRNALNDCHRGQGVIAAGAWCILDATGEKAEAAWKETGNLKLESETRKLEGLCD